MISVIVPVYNTEKYLERCIDSLLEQTYSDLEIICVNDGSSDSSGDILEQLAKKDKRVKVIQLHRQGVSVARNTALEYAHGEYIGFVDSDDYVAPDYYEKLKGPFENNEVDMTTCTYYMDFDGEIKTCPNQKEVPDYPMSLEEFMPYMYTRDMYKGVAGYLWTRLVKKDVLKNEDGSLKIMFHNEFGGADDIVFVAQMSAQCRKMQYVDKPLYYYFQRDNSIVHDNSTQLKTLHWAGAYEEIMDYYENKGFVSGIDAIKKMYVFRCGKLLEIAIDKKDQEKIELLKDKIRRYLSVYVESNKEHTDRIEWIENILNYEA